MTETEDKAPQGQPRPGRNEKTRRRRGGRRNPEGEAGKITASEVFRASFLECLDAEDAASFASFGEALFRSVLEGAPSLPGRQPSESATHRELRAIAVDLQMTEKQLLHVSREREECDLDAADTALSTMAERYAWAYIFAMRAQMSLSGGDESDSGHFSSAPDMTPEERELRGQIAQIASEGGRFFSRLVGTVLHLLAGVRPESGRREGG